MADTDEEAFPEGDGVPQHLFRVGEGLTPLQAVVECAAEGNPPGQRVAYILSIPAAAADSGLDEARTVLLPLLSQLAFDDHPDVKQATAEVLGPLGSILAAKDPELAEAGGSADAMDLLVLAHRLLQDTERGVQESAASSVAQFARLLSKEHRDEHLSAVVDALMHDYDDEQMQECAIDLLVKVVATGGAAHPDWCERHALPRLLRLANHRDYGIRVHSVTCLVHLAGCLPEEQRGGSLLSCFADLCGDQVWSVRQECAAELAALAARLPRPAARERLLPLWRALAGDASAWVAAAARRQAGPLLAGLHPDDCSEELLDAFVSAADGPPALAEACAHTLPAVLRNLGPPRWPQLRGAVAALAASECVAARTSLAGSAHLLAAMLGRLAVASDLLPIVELLSRDEHPAVCDALAANVRALLAALPPEARQRQLGFLARLHPDGGASCGQWRMRLLVAEQLAGVAALLGPQGLAEVLLPATLRLCEDPVAAVREEAAQQLGSMVRELLAAPPAQEGGAGSEERADEGLAAAAAAAEHTSERGGPPDQPAATASLPPSQQLDAGNGGGEGGAQPAAGAAVAPAAAEGGGTPAAGAAGGAEGGGWAAPTADPAAAVMQIVQHLVELQRSGCYRMRQTYISFCAALLLPPAATPPGAGEGGEGGGAAAAPAAGWPPLPEAVANGGVVAGLLAGAVALQADPVPNVRIAVARLLAAVARQQPRLLAASPHAAAALASLAADGDRDVAAAAAAGAVADAPAGAADASD